VWRGRSENNIPTKRSSAPEREREMNWMSLCCWLCCVAFHPMLLLRVYSNLYIGRFNLNSPAAAAAAPSVSLSLILIDFV